MATKLENLELDKAHYKNIESQLIKYIRQQPANTKRCKTHKDALLDILDMGLLQVSTAFELVMSQLANTTIVSRNSHDLGNGADCKLTTVRHSRHNTNYSAPVGDIAGKTGTLYVQCYERIQDKFYYFAIPNTAYCKIPKSSNIEIPFHLDGTPRRIPGGKRRYDNWWDYECTSLRDMATFCGTTGQRINNRNPIAGTPAVTTTPTWLDLFVGWY